MRAGNAVAGKEAINNCGDLEPRRVFCTSAIRKAAELSSVRLDERRALIKKATRNETAATTVTTTTRLIVIPRLDVFISLPFR